MAFAQLTYRESLRDIEACLSAQASKLYHMGFREPIRRSTLSNANKGHRQLVWVGLAGCGILQCAPRILLPTHAADFGQARHRSGRRRRPRAPSPWPPRRASCHAVRRCRPPSSAPCGRDADAATFLIDQSYVGECPTNIDSDPLSHLRTSHSRLSARSTAFDQNLVLPMNIAQDREWPTTTVRTPNSIRVFPGSARRV